MEECEKKKPEDIFSNLLMLSIIAIVGGSFTEISRYLTCFEPSHHEESSLSCHIR